MSIVSWILFLFVAAMCAWVAECVIPNKMPGGIVSGAIVGLIGAWIGGTLMGHVGPTLAGVALLPTVVGSAVLVFGCALLSSLFRRGR